jgi:glycosyltransferase involved in cell wall biosynthesis
MKLAIVNPTAGGLSGGYFKYLQKLVPLLRQHSGIHSLHLFLPPSVHQSWVGDDQLYTWPRGDGRLGFPQLKRRLGQLNPDVLFIPTGRWIECNSKPTVVMVRNMEPLIIPFDGNSALEGMKNLARGILTKKACRRATRVIAVSQYVRDFLIRQWKIPEEKIGLVYHGVESPLDRSRVLKPKVFESPFPERFIFTAGSIRPARGLEDLIYAFDILNKAGLLCNSKLVIAGGVDPLMVKYKNRLERLVSEMNIASKVVWAGRVSAEEMSWGYRNCAMFIMTSRTEACPNIVLEAMAHHCFCISTSNPPMPEFFGDGAIYYSPGKPETLSNAICNAISSGERRRKEVAQRAAARASNFSWASCVERTVAELDKAASC